VTVRQRKNVRLVFIYVACALLLLWALAPIYWVFVSSISNRTELYARPYKIWFPSEPRSTITCRCSPQVRAIGTAASRPAGLMEAACATASSSAWGGNYRNAPLRRGGLRLRPDAFPAQAAGILLLVDADDAAADMGVAHRLVLLDVAVGPY
jgi:ABC-type glycerol-3-phosphate transport system permease component